jgi:predicted PolB exonuclease-like 3'-5' exonuclease
MSMLVIDIAAVPDTDLGARLHRLADLSPADIARVMHTKNRERGQGDELPLAMQKIFAISCLLYDGEEIRIFSPAPCDSTEPDLLNGLRAVIADEDVNRIIAWDGNLFTFPLLKLRYLAHTLVSPLTHAVACSDLGTEFTSTYAAGNDLSLHEISVLCGFPGNPGMSANATWKACREGLHNEICNNSDLNVINCWLVYLNWRLVTGSIDTASLTKEHKLLQESLNMANKTHLADFARQWVDASTRP